MTDLVTLLAPDRLVDLTQPLGPGTALWPRSLSFTATTVAGYDTDPGYARELEVPVFAILPPDA